MVCQNGQLFSSSIQEEKIEEKISLGCASLAERWRDAFKICLG